MKYEWMDDYCLSMAGVTRDYQPAWDALRYWVGDKMMAMQGHNKEGRPIFTLKLEPLLNEAMQRQYAPYIVPGYYTNKVNWSSIDLTGHVPDDVVRSLLDASYQCVFSKLTKKKQREIMQAKDE